MTSRAYRNGGWAILLPALLLGLTLLLAGCSRQPPTGWQLETAELVQLRDYTLKLLAEGEATGPPALAISDTNYQVYVSLWRSGSRLGSAWADDIEAALRQAAEAAGPGQALDYIQLDLAYGFRTLDTEALGDDLSQVHRGVRGLQVAHAGRVLRYAPGQMVAENLSFERALGKAARLLALSGNAMLEEATISTFEAAQVLIDQSTGEVVQLLRGNRLVSQSAVDRGSVRDMARAMGDWMLRNLHSDGRMTYMYYPASGRESSSNNMIRQWMASLALTRLGLYLEDRDILDAARRNIDYNLAQFYSREGELGIIEYRHKVKLGAVALAALAIAEHPDRQAYADEFQSLVATTDALWQEDGSFHNFHRPAARNSEANLHNFYPGETLLLWATMLQHKVDPERQRRFMRSFEYYRQWHLDNRKPAFVPWHAQAYFLEWQRTGNPELAEWIFTMSDWLLNMQRDSRVAYDDTLGRFYDPAPAHAHFGPPHASSTGVYIEGLIDAYMLALAEGDEARVARYADSLEQGLRSSMQLQFQDDITAWFVADRSRVSGGLRTTVYNNVIRVDNVQHTLMGVLKILAHLEQNPQTPLLH